MARRIQIASTTMYQKSNDVSLSITGKYPEWL